MSNEKSKPLTEAVMVDLCEHICSSILDNRRKRNACLAWSDPGKNFKGAPSRRPNRYVDEAVLAGVYEADGIGEGLHADMAILLIQDIAKNPASALLLAHLVLNTPAVAQRLWLWLASMRPEDRPEWAGDVFKNLPADTEADADTSVTE